MSKLAITAATYVAASTVAAIATGKNKKKWGEGTLIETMVETSLLGPGRVVIYGVETVWSNTVGRLQEATDDPA